MKESTFKTISQKMPIVKEAAKILQIPYEVTKSLQKPECTLSDFYGMCIMMREKLRLQSNQHNRTNLANKLLNEFEERRPQFIRNQAMLAAVCLDRRFTADMEDREVELGKLTLCNIWEKLKNSRNVTEEVCEQPVHEIDDDEIFDFAKYFRSKGLTASNTAQLSAELQNNNIVSQPNGDCLQATPNYEKSKSEFLLSLNEFERKFPLLHHGTSILKFWEEQKNNYKEIYEVALIILSIPPSQATVERSFSQFSFVFDCRRSRISSKLLEEILIIKLNKSSAYDVLQEDLKKMKDDLQKKWSEEEEDKI